MANSGLLSFTHTFKCLTWFSTARTIQHLFDETAWSILLGNHKNDVTSLIKFCMENTSRRRVFSVNFD